jgi:hypothetical protein
LIHRGAGLEFVELVIVFGVMGFASALRLTHRSIAMLSTLN